MDVTTINGASAFQQQTIASNVQSSVDLKVLNVARQEGAGELQLLAGATQPTTGSNASPSNGVDVYA